MSPRTVPGDFSGPPVDFFFFFVTAVNKPYRVNSSVARITNDDGRLVAFPRPGGGPHTARVLCSAAGRRCACERKWKQTRGRFVTRPPTPGLRRATTKIIFFFIITPVNVDRNDRRPDRALTPKHVSNAPARVIQTL